MGLGEDKLGATKLGSDDNAGGGKATVISLVTTARVRSGSATPVNEFPPTPPAVVVNRWQLFDPVLFEFYTFETNPNAGGSPQRQRTITVEPTTANDGTPIVFVGAEKVWTSQFSGVVRSRNQYDQMVIWFNKNYPILLIDDLGRQMQVVLEQFTPKRAWVQRTIYRHTYTATMRILTFGTGTFNRLTAGAA